MSTPPITIKAEWMPDGLWMMILESFSWTHPTGRVWEVKAGALTNGASIPRALWSVVGSPFTGEYRIPAVLHDVAYSTLGVRKADADIMLRDASLAFGCEHWLAEALYTGVRFGGLWPYANAQREAARLASLKP